MRISNVVFLFVLPLVVGCTAVGDARGVQRTTADSGVVDAVSHLPSADAVFGSTSPIDPSTGVVVVDFGPQDPQPYAGGLAIWNDPEFKRRFIESYKPETEIEPELPEDQREAALEVMKLISTNRFDEALTMLAGLRTPESSAIFDFVLGNVFFQQDNLKGAISAYHSAVEKHAKYRRAWGNLAQAYLRNDDELAAIRAFTRVIEYGGSNATLYGMLGVAQMRIEDYIAAETAFCMAIMLSPEKIDLKMGLAESLLKQRRYADALPLFDKLIGERPDLSKLWLAQAEAYARLNQPLKAAQNLEMVDALGGATYDTLTNIGNIYANHQLFGLALDAFARAMKREPNRAPDRPMKAAKYMTANGAHAEATRLIEAIESTYGDRLQANERTEMLWLQARIAIAKGVGEDKVAVLETIVEMDPLDGDALILLGSHARSTGENEKAAFYFERASGIEEFEAKAKVAHGQLLVGMGQYRRAVPLLKRAQALRPREDLRKYLEQIERFAQKR